MIPRVGLVCDRGVDDGLQLHRVNDAYIAAVRDGAGALPLLIPALTPALPVDALLDGFARVTLDSDNAGRFLSGLRRRGDWPDCAQLAVYGPAPSGTHDALLGSAHSVAGELIPTRLLSPVEVSQCVAQHSAATQLESVVL